MRLYRTDVGGACLKLQISNLILSTCESEREGKPATEAVYLTPLSLPKTQSGRQCRAGPALERANHLIFFRVLMCIEEDFIIIVVEPAHPCIQPVHRT
jgi:hypothetical protein